MGFLKKLFEKKDCEICGGEIGLFGNKKLVDGDMCKDCAAKLSPWFTERKESTVEEIKEQLAYREANAAELQSSFRATKTLGEYYKMYVMYENGCPSRFVVTLADNYVENNADIIRFTDVVSCKTDIRDSRTEVKRKNEEGEEVSYNPPRYEFRYEFYIELTLTCPYFDKIRFKVNLSTVKLISELQTNRSMSGLGQFLLTDSDFDPTYSPEFRRYQTMCDEIEQIVRQGQNPSAAAPAQAAEESGIPEELLETERQLEFGDRMKAETDPLKKAALCEEEYARVKDNPALEAYAVKVAEWRDGYRQAGMTPEEMAEDAADSMLEQQKKLMRDAGYSEEDIEASLTAKTGGAETEDSPKLGDPGVCPDCGATDQTGKFCEYCGAAIG